MSARAIGSGTISFGLVSIPVKLFSASESGTRVSFNQLHRKCKGRLKQQLFCPTDNEVVGRQDIVKGYEFAKDQYVLFEEAELDALEQESTKAMDITEFVPLATVDPLFFETGYYLGPDKGAERAFRLLAVALTRSSHAAVAQYSIRGRQNLILLRPLGEGLVMQQLRYADEVKSQSEVPLGEGEVKPAELELAQKFIEQLSVETFDPSKYKDEHRARVTEIIDKKVKGETVTFAPASSPAPRVVDLMEALKASLARSPPASDVPDVDARKPPRKSPGKTEAEAVAPKKARRK